MEYKQVILVRQDLKMDKGKFAAQCSHAAVETTLRSSKAKVNKWREQGMKKVVLKVKDKKELFQYKKFADQAGLTAAIITDAGKTFFKRPTITCMGIGPDKEEKIDDVTGKLKMF